MRYLAIASLALAMTAGAPAVSDGYAPESRARAIGEMLDALQSISRARLDALQNDLYLGSRQKCRAALGVPTAACLIDLAGAICRQRPAPQRAQCRLVADVIITNQLSESELIDDKTRAKLMGAEEGFRAALQSELETHYAALVSELALTGAGRDSADLPRAIDAFCVERARSRALAWQRCVAAIVWYIGKTESARRSDEREE